MTTAFTPIMTTVYISMSFPPNYLPDSILVPDNSLKANYWKDENAQNIISAVAHEMEQKGYVRTEDKEKANETMSETSILKLKTKKATK